MSLVRILTSVERVSTNAAAGLLRTSMRILTRLLGRGRHRAWRKQAQENLRRRGHDLRR